jgi:hypothetical protein
MVSFPRFVFLRQEKSGNPNLHRSVDNEKSGTD